MSSPPSPAASVASILSSSPSCASLSSSRSTCSSDSSAPIQGPSVARPNEHLAVLLPRHLWKEDSATSHCDSFHCRVPFSVFERRHHCRKCGGIYCKVCSAHSTPLLDTSKLAFLHPPAGTPLNSFESPISPIAPARVCDDCFDQIHGLRSPCVPPPRPPRRTNSLLASPISLFRVPRAISASAPSSAPSSPPSPSILPPGGISRTRPSSPSSSCTPSPTPASPLSRHPSHRAVQRAATLPEVVEQKSYGELDAYPLRRASLLCKATGGGRWQPKPEAVDPTLRVPVIGGKAPYELEMEREEAEEQKRRSNPVIRDGDFQYRFPALCDPEPVALERPPMHLSTF